VHAPTYRRHGRAARMCVQRACPAQRTVPAARRGLTAQDPPPAARMHPARIYRTAHAACTRASPRRPAAAAPCPSPARCNDGYPGARSRLVLVRRLCRMRLRGAGPRQIAALARSNAKDRTDLIPSKTRLRCKDSTARIGAPMLAGNACRLADPTDADDRYESAHRGAAPEARMGSSRPDRTTSTAGWAHTCRRWRALQVRAVHRACVP